MKIWKYSLYLSIFSCASQVIILFLPDQYSIFIRNQSGLNGGKLFPVMWLIWLSSLAAFAINNIFADNLFYNENISMSGFKKYLPTFLGLPAFFSFMWTVYSWVKTSW